MSDTRCHYLSNLQINIFTRYFMIIVDYRYNSKHFLSVNVHFKLYVCCNLIFWIYNNSGQQNTSFCFILRPSPLLCSSSKHGNFLLDFEGQGYTGKQNTKQTVFYASRFNISLLSRLISVCVCVCVCACMCVCACVRACMCACVFDLFTYFAVSYECTVTIKQKIIAVYKLNINTISL